MPSLGLFLTFLAKGDLIGCFGLTESDAGSDPSSMKTNSVEKDDCYILNGSKTWITNSPIADVLIIWAKDEQGVLRGFIVDRDSKGLTTPPIEGIIFLVKFRIKLDGKEINNQ